MPYKPIEIERMLARKLKMTIHNADHKWFEMKLQGLPPIRTKLSNNKKDVGPGLEGMICRQLHVKKTFFTGLMDCTKSKEDYEHQVRADPNPPFENLITS